MEPEAHAHQVITDLACSLTNESAGRIARLLAEGASDARIADSVGSPGQRDTLRRLARARPLVGDAALALALISSAAAFQKAHQQERVALVWSGPDSQGHQMRRTEQALLDVISGARQRLLVVSFVVFAVPVVNLALADAAARGVDLTLVVDMPEAEGLRGALDPIVQLGQAARTANVLTWDRSLRPEAASGAKAKLHAKCACADDSAMLLSSANLTPHALGINLELGVLIYGGDTPRAVRERFEKLARDGVLRTVSR